MKRRSARRSPSHSAASVWVKAGAGGAAEGGEAAPANEEEASERALKAKLDEVRAQLEVEKKTVDELTDANAARVAEITRMEHEARVENERHAHERRLLEEEGMASDLRLDHDRSQVRARRTTTTTTTTASLPTNTPTTTIAD